MGTIAITITSGVGAPYPLSKTYTIADADITNCVAAFQAAANQSINGTATIGQVWLYIASLWAAMLKSAVQQNQTVPAVVPAPITMT